MIQFFAEEVELPDLNPEVVSKILVEISKEEGFEVDNINYIFCNDEYLKKINIEYLNHDYYTDIITFPLQDKPIQADIFISTERVNENALELGVSFEQELHRVISHGLLHLIGYDDKSEESVSIMRAKEEACLKKFNL